ncbi:uncharacterized protein LOC143035280 [Oratosquilla oratoria]|uniref:uncharacterized protein LOC143035280 n=1 Tax=Oratosquilla oratoria TaxID=337810 RepID=UPI003F75C73B
MIVEDIEIRNLLGRSDHGCVIFRCNMEPQVKNCKGLVYLFEKADYCKLNGMLNINWDEYLDTDDIEDMWCTFNSKLQESIDKCIPRRELKNNGELRKRTNHNLPMNRKLWAKIKKKQRFWMLLKKMMEGREINQGEYDKLYEEYRRINNQVRPETRSFVKNVEKTIAQNVKSNPKIFWKYVQSKTKASVSICNLYKDLNKTSKTKDDNEKATVLADFFSSVITKEPEGLIPEVEVKDIPMLSQIEFSSKDIISVIDKLQRNKSPGPERLHPRILKETKDVIAYPLCKIFNLSLLSERLPIDWKLANISAIYKKGDRSDPGNYRPVSLTVSYASYWNQ